MSEKPTSLRRYPITAIKKIPAIVAEATNNGAPEEKKEQRKESAAIKAAKEVTKISQNVHEAASVAGGTSARASDIRSKFEKGRFHFNTLACVI